MNKYLILTLILILAIPVNAKQDFVLNVGEETSYKGSTFKLEKVGSQGSAQISIDGTRLILNLGKEVEHEKFKITLIETLFYTTDQVDRNARLQIDFLGECIEDSDCNSYDCFQSFCEAKQCRKLLLSGCPNEGECKPQGTVIETSQLNSFCSTNNKWIPRKENKEYCLYDYECKSNVCDVYCKDDKYPVPSWVLALIGFIIILKALPFTISPHKFRKINENYFKHFSDLYFRIISIVLMIIGIVLIILAL